MIIRRNEYKFVIFRSSQHSWSWWKGNKFLSFRVAAMLWCLKIAINLYFSHQQIDIMTDEWKFLYFTFYNVCFWLWPPQHLTQYDEALNQSSREHKTTARLHKVDYQIFRNSSRITDLHIFFTVVAKTSSFSHFLQTCLRKWTKIIDTGIYHHFLRPGGGSEDKKNENKNYQENFMMTQSLRIKWK